MIIFVDEQIPFLSQSLSGYGKISTFSGRKLTSKDLITSQCEILFVRSTTNVGASLLEGTKVGFVGTATSGIEHIDTEYLHSKGITFAFAPGSNANSVAEYVVFGILHWVFTFGYDPCNLKIGIIGFGHIGSRVGKYANYFGWKVLVNDPPLLEKIQTGDAEPFPDFVVHCHLQELLESSDVITIHVPLTFKGKYKTHKLLNESNLHSISSGTLFINTSRGGVVDESSLIRLSKTTEIALIIDVWEKEPDVNLDLLDIALIATPHIAGYSFDGKIRGTLAMLEAFERFTSLRPDFSKINPLLADYNPLPPEDFKNPRKIYEKLFESRKILDDSIRFKQVSSLIQQARKQFFDEFRSNYPNRREIL